MKKIKDFLFKKRIKILRNKKGFSLVEVLVAVAIIGIISAVAIPQVQDHRETASLTAGNVSMGNIARAFNQCLALNDFNQCNTLSALKVECSSCESAATAPQQAPLCFGYKKGSFRMCVQLDAQGGSSVKLGGDFQVCHEYCHGATTAPDPANNVAAGPCHNVTTTTAANAKLQSTIKKCTTNTQCTASSAAWTAVCQKKTGANAGKCVNNECKSA